MANEWVVTWMTLRPAALTLRGMPIYLPPSESQSFGDQRESVRYAIDCFNQGSQAIQLHWPSGEISEIDAIRAMHASYQAI
jgi:hypothetical protein